MGLIDLVVDTVVGQPGNRRHRFLKAAANRAAQAAGSIRYSTYERVEHEGFPQSIQLDDFSCGAQCVKMVLDYFLDRDTSENRLLRRLKTSRNNGTSTPDMVRVLREAGLTACSRRGGKGTADAIRRAIDNDRVVIALVPTWNPQLDCAHWVCIYGHTTRPKKLLMMRDPAGLRPIFRPKQRVSEYIVVGQQ
jgi:ABC-type bacteriocin/lantibiotic exporter with double-glycine peptidase domain